MNLLKKSPGPRRDSPGEFVLRGDVATSVGGGVTGCLPCGLRSRWLATRKTQGKKVPPALDVFET